MDCLVEVVYELITLADTVDLAIDPLLFVSILLNSCPVTTVDMGPFGADAPASKLGVGWIP